MTNTQFCYLSNLEKQISYLEQAQSRVQKCIIATSPYATPSFKQTYQSVCERQEASLIRIRESRRQLIDELW